jgi:hypothetical protein
MSNSEPERIDRRRTALIAYDVCRRALTPSDPARREAIRPVLDAWVKMIAVARAAGVPVNLHDACQQAELHTRTVTCGRSNLPKLELLAAVINVNPDGRLVTVGSGLTGG